MVLTRALAVTALLLCHLLLTAGSAFPAGAGQASSTLRGRVNIGTPLSSSVPPAHGEAADRLASAVLPETYRRAVVFLESPPERLDRLGTGRGRMDQKNERFSPHLLAITTGTIVDFPNGDRIYHNVFSLSKTKRFDLGRYAAGRSKSVRFDQPGIVRVFCEIHSHMNAFILVFDHRFFALTDEDGRYRIDGVPPGTYRVTAWYEGVSRETQTVVVPASGGTEVNFNLR